jgi:hypothetical protein
MYINHKFNLVVLVDVLHLEMVNDNNNNNNSLL